MGRAFSQLLRLKALVAIMAHLLAVIARNMHKVFGALWYLLMSWVRRGSVGTVNGCSLTLSVEHLPAVLHCMILLGLLDPVVVGLSPDFILVEQDIIDPATSYTLHLFGLEDLQFHCKLLKLVLGVKQILLFEYCLLHC